MAQRRPYLGLACHDVRTIPAAGVRGRAFLSAEQRLAVAEVEAALVPRSGMAREHVG
jgi:hypothetical protein